MGIKLPEIMIFDYGHTLCYEPGFDMFKAYTALFKHVVKNPDGITPRQAMEFANAFFEAQQGVRDSHCECHEHQRLRAVLDYFGLELDIDIGAAEKIIWDNASYGKEMPHTAELLRCLKRLGIRSGVISNIGWSGAALAERINRLLPENEFEFIIASSEYGIRKPKKMLFEIALRKAGVAPDRAWYCGDTIENDVNGAHSAGLFAVLYEDNSVENPWAGQNDDLYGSTEYLHIRDWRELTAILEENRKSGADGSVVCAAASALGLKNEAMP